MEIRNLQEGDLAQVIAIEKATFSQPWTEQDFLQAIEDDSKIYLVAVEDGEILGYCGMWNVVGEGQITNVAVKESARRKGVARQMFSAFLQTGQDKGITSFTLEVRVSNVAAIGLYEQFGFVNAGIRKGFYDFPKEDGMIMWKVEV